MEKIAVQDQSSSFTTSEEFWGFYIRHLTIEPATCGPESAPGVMVTLQSGESAPEVQRVLSPEEARWLAARLLECVSVATQRAKAIHAAEHPPAPRPFVPLPPALSYGPDWQRIANAVRERDAGACQRCALEPGERQFDVHHIRPLRTFNGDHAAANDMDNLQTLCPSCHRRADAACRAAEVAALAAVDYTNV